MLYLDVLPAFMVYLLLFGAATLISSLTRAGKPLSPYLWRALLSSVVGVLVADACLWAIVFTAGRALHVTNEADLVRQIVDVLAIFGPVLQPLPMSLFGAATGIVVGLGWGLHSGRGKNARVHESLA